MCRVSRADATATRNVLDLLQAVGGRSCGAKWQLDADLSLEVLRWCKELHTAINEADEAVQALFIQLARDVHQIVHASGVALLGMPS